MSGLGNSVDTPSTPALCCQNHDPNSPLFSSRSQSILKPDAARSIISGIDCPGIQQARRDHAEIGTFSRPGPVYLLLRPDSGSASGSALGSASDLISDLISDVCLSSARCIILSSPVLVIPFCHVLVLCLQHAILTTRRTPCIMMLAISSIARNHRPETDQSPRRPARWQRRGLVALPH